MLMQVSVCGLYPDSGRVVRFMHWFEKQMRAIKGTTWSLKSGRSISEVFLCGGSLKMETLVISSPGSKMLERQGFSRLLEIELHQCFSGFKKVTALTMLHVALFNDLGSSVSR